MDSLQLSAKIFSAPVALLLSGYMVSPSQNAVPLLYNLPASISTPIFDGVYHRGAALVIPTAIISVTSSAYLGYSNPAERALYAFSGVATFAILPWTQLVMFPGIYRLIDLSTSAAAEQEKADKSGEATRLMKSWVLQNWVRAGLNLAGGLVGLWAMLAEEQQK